MYAVLLGFGYDTGKILKRHRLASDISPLA